MKKLLLILLLLPGLISAATPAVTKADYFTCMTKQYHSDMTGFMIAKDRANMDAYVALKYCFVLRAGLQVTIIDVSWGKCEFVVQGIKLWAACDALKR